MHKRIHATVFESRGVFCRCGISRSLSVCVCVCVCVCVFYSTVHQRRQQQQDKNIYYVLIRDVFFLDELFDIRRDRI